MKLNYTSVKKIGCLICIAGSFMMLNGCSSTATSPAGEEITNLYNTDELYHLMHQGKLENLQGALESIPSESERKQFELRFYINNDQVEDAVSFYQANLEELSLENHKEFMRYLILISDRRVGDFLDVKCLSISEILSAEPFNFEAGYENERLCREWERED